MSRACEYLGYMVLVSGFCAGCVVGDPPPYEPINAAEPAASYQISLRSLPLGELLKWAVDRVADLNVAEKRIARIDLFQIGVAVEDRWNTSRLV